MRRRLVDHVWIEEVTVTNHLHEASRVPRGARGRHRLRRPVRGQGRRRRRAESRPGHDDHALALAYARAEFRRSVTIASTQPAATRARVAYRWRSPRVSSGRRPSRSPPTPRRRGPFGRAVGALDRCAPPSRRSSRLARRRARARPRIPRCCGPTARASAISPPCACSRISPGRHAARRRPAVVHGAVRPRQSDRELPGAALPARAGSHHAARARRPPGDVRDDFHEQEPGKILHELRFGELTARGERPHSPYFGTADATPLFLVLLDEYHRWSGDDELVGARDQRPRGAGLDEESGDLDGDGYVEYERRNLTTGLVNQCWKDSWNSIQLADGTARPRADRDLRDPGLRLRRAAALARLAREVWGDTALAERLERRAAGLRARSAATSGSRARLPRARARRRQAPRRQPQLQHRPPAVVGMLDEDQAAATAERLLDERSTPAGGFARSAPARPATTRSGTTREQSGPTTTR